MSAGVGKQVLGQLRGKSTESIPSTPAPRKIASIRTTPTKRVAPPIRIAVKEPKEPRQAPKPEPKEEMKTPEQPPKPEEKESPDIKVRPVRKKQAQGDLSIWKRTIQR